MAIEENNKWRNNLKINAVELLDSSIVFPKEMDQPPTDFNFKIKVENRIDSPRELILSFVNIEISDKSETVLLGSLTVSSVYQLIDFVQLIKVKEDGLYDIPKELLDMINSISLSTTRGVMFSTFKGTLLHNAILPLVDAEWPSNK